MQWRRRRLFSPGQLLRQAGSVVLYGLLTRWRYMPQWLISARSLLGLVAGSEGMGCIGFPKHPVIEITSRCNLNCIHCHAASSEGSPDEMSFDEMRRVLRELAAQDEFKMIVFSGGEPLVRDDLVELCDYARRLGFWVVIASNGTLLTADLARRLRRAGVCGIAIGLDGDCPEIHDSIRGVEGAFERAIQGCVVARQAGLVLQINTTLMQQNVARLPQIMRLGEHLGAKVALCYFAAACGRGAENQGILLTPEQYEAALRQIADIQSGCRLIIEPTCAPTYWAMLGASNWLSSLLVRLVGPAVFHGCVAGTGLFYVRADGEALACPFLPLSAGSVLTHGVSRIWQEGGLFEQLRSFKTRPESPNCSACHFFRVCGGCRARAFLSSDDAFGDDPFCFLSP
ncbi:radical SAM protein [bacterium]|nr:radical SAM protein [bacterium]